MGWPSLIWAVCSLMKVVADGQDEGVLKCCWGCVQNRLRWEFNILRLWRVAVYGSSVRLQDCTDIAMRHAMHC